MSDNVNHQDWCRWWSHGDLCSCGALSQQTEPVAWMSDDSLLKSAEAMAATGASATHIVELIRAAQEGKK